MKNIITLFVIAGIVGIYSCKKESSTPLPTNYTPGNFKGVFVVNEGNYNGGDASISFFSNESPYVNTNLYYSLNNNTALGDVAQSMCIFKSKAYIVVNNSAKVVVVSMSDFKKTGTITGISLPRFFLGIDDTKGYVTSWGDSSVDVVNLTTLSVIKSIPCGHGPEQMVLVNGKVFVTNVGGYTQDSSVTVIDAASDNVIATIPVGLNPNSIRTDVNGKVWVLCGGTLGPDWTPSTPDDEGGNLMQIDPISDTIVSRFAFTYDQHPIKLNINDAGNTLYFLSGTSEYTGRVFNMYITDSIIPINPIINNEFYGLGIQPVTNRIYTGRASFPVNSYMLRYQSNGTFIDSVQVGVGPNSFVFN